ncbi:MAG: toprim domain-containing protein [Rhizobiales bacterium]|nr:toprim domain-containing protein [Hyphomicrobiales bacterium]
MRAEDVARRLNGRKAKEEWLCRCPVPGHGKGRGDLHPSLSVRDGRQGLLVKCHAGCEQEKVLAAIGYRPSVAAIANPVTADGHFEAANQNEDIARRAWRAGLDPRGTLAEAYLSSRGLVLPTEFAHHVLRYAPAAPWNEDTANRVERPTLLAAFARFEDSEVTGLQRTALAEDGSWLDRRMLGRTRGSAIKLGAVDAAARELVICEGLETGLSALVLGFSPVWVLGSVGRIGTFLVLPDIERLTILRETDDEGASIAASLRCAERWHAAGRQVRFVTPLFRGDIDDVRANLARLAS